MANKRDRLDPSVRRSLILREAISLVGERGYYGFKIQELAARCGLSNPGLLHHFRSKHDVLLGILDELESSEAGVIGQIVNPIPGDGVSPSRAAVTRALETMLERAAARGALLRAVLALQAEATDPGHPAHFAMRRREEVLLEFVTGLLEPYVENPQASAQLTTSLLDGLAAQWLRSDCSFDLPERWRQGLARLLPELACPNA